MRAVYFVLLTRLRKLAKFNQQKLSS